MPNLTLSNEQVIDLFKQLPEDQKQEVYKILILSQWDRWESLSLRHWQSSNRSQRTRL